MVVTQTSTICYDFQLAINFSKNWINSQVTVIFQLMHSDVCVQKQAANMSNHS